MTGSNRRPPACKAGALPAELIPHRMSISRALRCCSLLAYRSTRRRSRLALLASSHSPIGMVGLGGLEPPTPALSRRCSNQLSYRPEPVAGDQARSIVVGDNLPTTDKCGRLN